MRLLTFFALALSLAGRVTAATSAPPADSVSSALAFPTAEGFAAHASGGRGGEVYHVTTLNDDGPGSLRDACSHGHRIIVFDVAGYVDLHSILHIGSDLTIAGQTAPGEGIATKGHEISFSDSHNVIIRFIRFRQGTADSKEEKKSAVNITNGKDIMLDHVSIEWGRWDTLDMNKSTDVTVQYSIIGPGVSPQRFGSLCESDGVTFSHDLWIENHSRNPKSKGKVQFINNVVYAWQLDAYIAGASAGDNWHDVIGNYFISGPETKHGPFARGNEHTHIFVRDNYYDDNKNGKLDGKPVPDSELGGVTLLKAPFAAAAVKIDPPEKAYEIVAAQAGCSLHRDSVDQKLIDDLRSLGVKGKTISTPDDMGGFGEIKGGSAPAALPQSPPELEAFLDHLAGDGN